MNKNIKEHTTTKNVYLFSKLLICPECGRVLVGNYQNQRNYYVYRCNNYAINGLCKFNHTCSENKIEKLLLDEIKTKVNNEISIKLIKNPKNDKMKKQKRIEAVKNQIDRLQDLYIDGTIDKEKFNSKYTSLNNELNELEHSIEPAVESVTKELMNTNIEELYDKLDREHKQAFWHKFIDKIYYYPKQKRIEVVYK